MRTHQTQYTGAFGVTEVSLTPNARRIITFDMKNCPHCGNHHASMDVEIETNDRAIIRCPALGGAKVEVIIKLFLNVP